MKLTAELTAEEIVTNLLTSQEILKRKKENFYISNGASLGDYLRNLPADVTDSCITPSPALPLGEGDSESKYTFIDCHKKWVI